MAELGEWMLIPLPEEDQVVSNSPEPKDTHFPKVLVAVFPLTSDEVPYEEDEDSLNPAEEPKRQAYEPLNSFQVVPT